ncbi:aminopeptidase P N-terminal domain-containing protein [soil metagenome]
MSMQSFILRRNQLLKQMQAHGGGVAILPTAHEMTRNSDNSFPFRHDSYFYYLSGFTEPEAVIVLVADGNTQRSILFCREKNLEREIWDGFRFGPVAAQTQFGFDAAFPIDALDAEMPALLADAAKLFYSSGTDARLDLQLQSWLETVRGRSRSGVSVPNTSINVRALLDEMRLFKDASEISLMQGAARISGAAHARAMRFAKPGLYEYELEAELLHEFRRQGSQAPAYGSIVAAGANACVLHYQSNAAQIKDGELILIDAGCELDSYASDITRTFPANGNFSDPQKILYELVLAAQQAALACARPGSLYIAGHQAAVKVLTQGMLDTGLLDKNKVGSLEDAVANQAFRQFYMHGTGHWLGLDVHDVGDYRVAEKIGAERPYRQLEAGMVFTIEPGIYVRPAEGVPEQFWHIGIRIEDDILVTPEGHLNLSSDTPKTVAEIEATMRSK